MRKIYRLFVVLFFVFNCPGLAEEDKVPELTSDQVKAHVKELWNIPPAVFTKVEKEVKKKWPDEDPLKTTIKVLDLAKQKTGSGRAGGMSLFNENIKYLVKKYQETKDWDAPAKEVGLSGAADLDYRVTQVLHGKEPGDKPKEELQEKESSEQ